MAKKIREYRGKYNWGAEVICVHLKLDHGIKVSEGRVNRFLKKKGFLKSTKKRKVKSKHTQVVKVENPGEHTQSDVKHLPHILKNGIKSYVYNFVDHASKWEFKRAYDSYGPGESKDFAERLLEKVPFTISRWQTDNGIEVTYKYVTNVDNPRDHAFDRICRENDIRHVLIPPGEKELQGLVERSHRMDDDELYHRIEPKDLVEFNRILETHTEWKNNHRRRKALGWKTSMEWLKAYEEKNLAGLVRPCHPIEAPMPVPNESLSLIEGTGHALIDGSQEEALKPNLTVIDGGGPNLTRQNFSMEEPKTEIETQDQNFNKRAA